MGVFIGWVHRLPAVRDPKMLQWQSDGRMYGGNELCVPNIDKWNCAFVEALIRRLKWLLELDDHDMAIMERSKDAHKFDAGACVALGIMTSNTTNEMSIQAAVALAAKVKTTDNGWNGFLASKGHAYARIHEACRPLGMSSTKPMYMCAHCVLRVLCICFAHEVRCAAQPLRVDGTQRGEEDTEAVDVDERQRDQAGRCVRVLYRSVLRVV